MSRQAFLVGVLDVSVSPPVLLGTCIFSSDAGDVCFSTSKRFVFDIAHSYGEDYGAAKKNLKREIAMPSRAAWALAYLVEPEEIGKMERDRDRAQTRPPTKAINLEHHDNDDAERIACIKAGEAGHTSCGICPTHRRPRFNCGVECWTMKPEEVDEKKYTLVLSADELRGISFTVWDGYAHKTELSAKLRALQEEARNDRKATELADCACGTVRGLWGANGETWNASQRLIDTNPSSEAFSAALAKSHRPGFAGGCI